MLRFSDVQPGIVETSGNLGILELGPDGHAKLQFLLRSLIDTAKRELAESMVGLLTLGGAHVEIYGDYPGWTPRLDSRVLPLFIHACEDELKIKPRIAVVHGGLECGILKAVNPVLDCISCGPVIHDMHSPRERLNLPSVAQFFQVLTRVLGTIPAA